MRIRNFDKCFKSEKNHNGVNELKRRKPLRIVVGRFTVVNDASYYVGDRSYSVRLLWIFSTRLTRGRKTDRKFNDCARLRGPIARGTRSDCALKRSHALSLGSSSGSTTQQGAASSAGTRDVMTTRRLLTSLILASLLRNAGTHYLLTGKCLYDHSAQNLRRIKYLASSRLFLSKNVEAPEKSVKYHEHLGD